MFNKYGTNNSTLWPTLNVMNRWWWECTRLCFHIMYRDTDVLVRRRVVSLWPINFQTNEYFTLCKCWSQSPNHSISHISISTKQSYTKAATNSRMQISEGRCCWAGWRWTLSQRSSRRDLWFESWRSIWMNNNKTMR